MFAKTISLWRPAFHSRCTVRRQQQCRLVLITITAIILVSLFTWNSYAEVPLYHISLDSKPSFTSWKDEHHDHHHYDAVNDTIPKIHLLLPGNKANHRICRTLTSALVNDYPPPVIINWQQNEGDHSMNGYDMTTGKNWGVLQYLRSLPASASDDLIIMADAHDVVFQLPPSVLVHRYNVFRRQTMARLIRQHGTDQVSQLGLDLSIVMGAEKFCWPFDHRHPACYAVPTSPLPHNAYGFRTDKSTHTNRPRWLCSGTIIGPVNDMLKLYERAHAMWTAYETGGGDQDYFSNIYGRQELSRQYQRGAKEWVFGFGEQFRESSLIFPHIETTHTDYKLGVDLTSTIFQSLNEALDDMSPVVHSNVEDLAKKDMKHRTSRIFGNQFPFPRDMLDLPVPRGAGKRWWRDVQLFTNFHARSIPAVLHYNGDKSKMDEWWKQQWWTGHGKQMLRERGLDKGLWMQTDRYVDGTAERIRWDDMCGDFEDKVFVEPVHDLA